MVYIVVSSISFFAGSMVWMVTTIFNYHSWPLSLFTEPALLLMVALFAIKRNEIRVIWFGHFYDPEFKDMLDVKQEMRDTMKTETTTLEMELNQAVLVGLKMDDTSEYQTSLRNSL